MENQITEITEQPEVKKRKGRIPGSRNRVHNADKVFWQRIVKRQRKKIEQDLISLTPYERLQILMKINSFIMTKPTSMDLSFEVDGMPAGKTRAILYEIFQLHAAK